MLEATALLTEPQPLPACLILIAGDNQTGPAGLCKKSSFEQVAGLSVKYYQSLWLSSQ